MSKMMSPFQILSPSERWTPSHTQFAASNDEYEKLLPPLVYRIRLADLDDIRKIKRLVIWCKEVNAAQQEYTYTPVYVKQEEWEKHQKDIKSFSDVCKICEVK